MIAHTTFNKVHVFVTGKGLARVREELGAEAFINRELKEEDVVSIAENGDQYTASTTVWYRKHRHA